MSSRIGKTFIFGGLALGVTAAQDVYAGVLTAAGFTFENLAAGTTTGMTIGPLAAEEGTGSAFGVHASAATQYSSPAGNGSLRSLNSNVWASGDYYEFRVATTNLQDVMVTFDHTRSSTGPSEFQFQYSTNGTSFTTFQTYTLAGSAFSTGTPILNTPGVNFDFDLSAITDLNDLSTAYFRLVSTGLNSSGGAVASGGTSRVDNFFVTGNEIPEPTSMALVSLAGAAALARRRRGN
jgi:hypothetical protein